MGTSTKKEDRIAVNCKQVLEKVAIDHELNITELANATGLSKQYISKVMSGKFGYSLGMSTIKALRKLYANPKSFDLWVEASRL
jgi:transcriptional regulator with XRE-family HTH domain